MDPKELVLEAQSGNMRAFQLLVQQYQQEIYRYAYTLAGCHEEAEDISQEVFVKAYQSLSSIREHEHFRAWLYRVTMNTWINHGRKKGMKIKKQQISIDQYQGDFPVTSDFNPDAETEKAFNQTRIHQALNCLSPKERAVFTLKHFQDLKLIEVAESLHLSTGTVKSLMFRAVRKLQKELADVREEWLEGGIS